MNTTQKLLYAGAAGALLAAAPALADSWHGHGHGYRYGHERYDHRAYARYGERPPYRVYERRAVVIERPLVIQRSYVAPPVVYGPPVLYGAPAPALGPAAILGAAIGAVIDERY